VPHRSVREALVHIGIHPSQFPDRLQAELVESVRVRRINPKLHYESRKQARAWLRLHEAHSPARRDRDCRETYQRAFDDLARQLGPGLVQIVGLGCGPAEKECRLIERMPQAGGRVSFVAIDVSVPLALTARSQAAELLPADQCHALVCDLAAADLAAHLTSLTPPGARRLLTCFGVLPNFRPGKLLPRLAALLQPGDHLLLSANFAAGPDYRAAVQAIRPQYDNPLTREWLTLLLDDLGIEPGDGHIEFAIEPDAAWDSLARISARFEFDRPRCVVLDSEEFRFVRGDRLELFFSYRHTPGSMRGLLASHGMRVEAQWITSSGEEGIFHACRADSPA
jgi:L-histidine Nalpha-methyltransferase